MKLLLIEGANIWDVYNKYYANTINKETYQALVNLDPTTNGESKGKYLPWIIREYQNNGQDVFDADIFNNLNWYHNHKAFLPKDTPDIYKLNIYGLNQLIIEFRDSVFNKQDIQNQIETVYEDSEWAIYCPQTWAAERWLVWDKLGGASWCTAADSDHGKYYFKHYTKDGDKLYVNLDKRTGKIYQYSPVSGEFNNKDNAQVNVENIGMSEGAFEYYEENGFDIRKGTFPQQDDIYYDGYFGLKHVGGCYVEYALCNSNGEIFGWMAHFDGSTDILWENQTMCLVKNTRRVEKGWGYSRRYEDNDEYYIIDSESEKYQSIDYEGEFDEENALVYGYTDDDCDTYIIYDLNKGKCHGFSYIKGVYEACEKECIIIEDGYHSIIIYNKVNHKDIQIRNVDTNYDIDLIDDTHIGYSKEDGMDYIYDLKSGTETCQSNPVQESIKKQFNNLLERMNKVVTNTNGFLTD